MVRRTIERAVRGRRKIYPALGLSILYFLCSQAVWAAAPEPQTVSLEPLEVCGEPREAATANEPATQSENLSSKGKSSKSSD